MARVIEEALVKSLVETGLRKAGEVDSQAKYALGCYRIDGGKLAEVFRHDGPMSAAAKGKCKAILSAQNGEATLYHPRERCGACALCFVLCCELPQCCCTGKFNIKGAVLFTVDDGPLLALGASGSKDANNDYLVVTAALTENGFSKDANGVYQKGTMSRSSTTQR